MEIKKFLNNAISLLSIIIIGAATLWVLSFVLPAEDKENVEKIKQEIKEEVKQEIKSEEKKPELSIYPDFVTIYIDIW